MLLCLGCVEENLCGSVAVAASTKKAHGKTPGPTHCFARRARVRLFHVFAGTRSLAGSTEQQSHPGREAWMACHPSLTTNGRRVSAATGSAHQIPKSALATSPASAIHARYPQSEDSAASALREALDSLAAKFRFRLASHGMPKAATTNNAMPTRLVRGS